MSLGTNINKQNQATPSRFCGKPVRNGLSLTMKII